MKNVFVIHGCPSNIEKAMDPATRTYDKHWMPWLKEQLTERGIETKTPLMPSPWEPNYDAFKSEFEKYSVNEDSILIGHSCGTTFLTRWLGDTKRKVAKLILVAPWCIADKNDEARMAFYEHPISESIKEQVGEIIIFTSDDEEQDGKKSAEIFYEKLGGRVINLKGHGHYTMDDMGTVEFPELLEEVLR